MALEGWRGVCALSVATMHLSQIVPWHLAQLPAITDSYLYVDFFFVLSGFVITHAYGRRIRAASDIASFAVRRFGRLWPLHVFMLIVLFAMECLDLLLRQFGIAVSAHAPFTLTRTPEGLIGNLVFLQGVVLWRGAAWNLPSWTISVEFWTYLVFAAICLLPTRRQGWTRAALALLGFLVLVAGGRHMYVESGLGLFRCAYGFFLGSLVCGAFDRTHRRVLPYPGLLEGLAVAATVLFVSLVGTGIWSMAAPLLFAAVVYVFAFEGGALSRVLSSEPMAMLGAWSYSIYLVHYALVLMVLTALKVVGWHLGIAFLSALQVGSAALSVSPSSAFAMDLVVVGYLGAVIAIAAMTYRYIETPWRRRFNAIAAPMTAGVANSDAMPARPN